MIRRSSPASRRIRNRFCSRARKGVEMRDDEFFNALIARGCIACVGSFR